MSVVTFEKPMPKIGLADWYATQWKNQQINDTRRNDAFNLRHESRQLRNETAIRTKWDSKRSNELLTDRITEIDRWRETFQSLLDRVNKQIEELRAEKFSSEREIDDLGVPIAVVSECLSTRDARRGTELTTDDAEVELKKELCILEAVKKNLIQRCTAAWEKANKLEEIKFKLEMEINEKTETREIDKEQLLMNKNCAGISYKIDILKNPRSAVSYEAWLEHSRNLKLLAESEMEDTNKYLEALFVIRQRSKNELASQRDCVDFYLRKRIYETQRARNELEWQQKKMREEMERVLVEITTLEASSQDKEDALKLAESRLQNRSFRPGMELAIDDVDKGLKEEVVQLRATLKSISDKLNCAKATYNALEEQQLIIDNDLDNKNQSMTTDIRCLDNRNRLNKKKSGGGESETDRNITLTRMEHEIPKT